ncbi:hypothetical protein [Streptomyces sp. 900105755]
MAPFAIVEHTGPDGRPTGRIHVLDAPSAQPRTQLVLRARAAEPRVMEPDKCVGWGWWPVGTFPEPTVACTRAAIDGIRHGRPCTETGWT